VDVRARVDEEEGRGQVEERTRRPPPGPREEKGGGQQQPDREGEPRRQRPGDRVGDGQRRRA
jgi:hypothetical protein